MRVFFLPRIKLIKLIILIFFLVIFWFKKISEDKSGYPLCLR